MIELTGLEPHPVLPLPPLEQIKEWGPELVDLFRLDRRELLRQEIEDPYTYGYEPPIWGLIDDLLCDGKQVELVGRDYLEIPEEIRKTQSPSLTIIGRRQLLISGANGASKTEYASKKCMKILRREAKKQCWAFHETERESIDRQQPLFMKFMPPEIRAIVLATGRYKRGAIANVSWTQKNGFTESGFVLDNGSSALFKNYKQEEQTVEGGQIDIAWGDELIPLGLARTLRYRLMAKRGILLLTFTPIKGWTATVQEYRQGETVLVDAPAPRLPIRDEAGQPTGRVERVPRVATAGPGMEGTLKANVIYLHSEDNPFLDKKELDRILEGATRRQVLERGYGVATRSAANQFPKFSERVHVLPAAIIPRQGTNYQIVDPSEGRNWAILYMRVHPKPVLLRDGSLRYRRYIYREWPSHGHRGPSANIPGLGDPGPWALPGNSPDGERGPAQDNFGWGYERYILEFERLEGSKLLPEPAREPFERAAPPLPPHRKPNPLHKHRAVDHPENYLRANGETIFERRMDSRFGAAPNQDRTGNTTILEQMTEMGVEYLPASGKNIAEGVQMINDALDYDEDVPIGQFSPTLGRINGPLLYVSDECPNLIYALKEWTGKEGQKGACKDFVDDLRYGFEDDLDFIPDDVVGAWQGGGTY